jgi:hypothetical protein
MPYGPTGETRMAEPLVHLVVTVVADQEGTAMKGEVVVFVGTEQMHREALDMKAGPYDLQRGALALHEAGLEALDVLSATNGVEAPPSPAKAATKGQRAPKRRREQAPARQRQADELEDDQTAKFTLTSSRPRSRRR